MHEYEDERDPQRLCEAVGVGEAPGYGCEEEEEGEQVSK
jgi:hypothetical protein